MSEYIAIVELKLLKLFSYHIKEFQNTQWINKLFEKKRKTNKKRQQQDLNLRGITQQISSLPP